ncbi:endonuclease/exonuclease/phosphatase family protein [Streptomyces sp. NPDC048604]|uniref:endonuclease/exonuclease/phosphatase family protein n=1 Tax=Streptomyces sp. NPDC048604 TaxID=3365578 RepID=UPI0037248ED7
MGRKGWSAHGRGSSWWGRGLTGAGLVAACLLAGHGFVPQAGVRVGSLVETFLPWVGLVVPVLVVVAALVRSWAVLVAAVVPGVVWAVMFGPLLVPESGGAGDLVVAQHNVSDENADPDGTARALRDAGPDLVALEELTPAALPRYSAALARTYPHDAVDGSVGLWSRYPLRDVRPVDLRPDGLDDPGWRRGLRATAATPHGDVAVYVVHLPSVRIGAGGFRSEWRDDSARKLGRVLAAEPLERVVLAGDLNSTLDDRALSPVTDRLAGPRSGLAFSWPASLPLARIDQVLVRGGAVGAVRALPATGSDHLPVLAHLSFQQVRSG